MTDYPRCATCRYWIPAGDPDARNTLYDNRGVDDDALNAWGVCEAMTAERNDLARACAGAVWWCGQLATKPDFGCILHEPREEDDDA